MDWARAKSIFIVVFIIMNILLVSYNVSNGNRQQVSKKMITDSITILNQRGVELECKIPEISGKKHDYTILPVYRILLMNFKVPQVIKNIELVYKENDNKIDDKTQTSKYPVWRITLQDQIVLEYDGITGKIAN